MGLTLFDRMFVFPWTEKSGGGRWLTPEMLSLFVFHRLRPLERTEEVHLHSRLNGRSTRAGTSFPGLVRGAQSPRSRTDGATVSMEAST